MSSLPSLAQRLRSLKRLAPAGQGQARAGHGWRLWRHLPGWNPYHGLWGPGIHLLRNLDLQSKSLVVGSLVSLLVVTLLVQLVQVRWAAYSSAHRAVTEAALVRDVAELQQVSREVVAGLARQQHGLGAPELPAMLQRQAMLHQQLADRLAPTLEDATALARLVQEWQGRHRALQVQQGEAAPPAGTASAAAVAAATTASAVPAVPTEARRSLAGGRESALVLGHAYLESISRLRSELRSLWADHVDETLSLRVLREGLVDTSAELALRLHRLAAAVTLEMELGLDGAAARRAVSDLLAESRTVLSLSRPMLERAEVELPAQSALIEAQLQLARRWLDAVDGWLRQPERSPEPMVGLQLAQARTIGRIAVEAADRLGEIGLEALDERLRQREAEMARSLLWQAVGLTLVFLFTLYLLVAMYRVLSGGLRFLGSQVQELGRGNLSIRPSGHGKDEIGVALTTLGRSAAHMSALFQAVIQGVAAVSHASREVAGGNAGLHGRTAEIRDGIGRVAASTQSFANAMDYSGVAIERVAEHVRTMRIEARRGRKATARLHTRMQSLQGRSREIVQVVALVEAVAHQTKLLALNASVEAARAGEQGKGFAVVAQEVRSLANRSEAAAHRIRAIVDESVREISEGSVTAKRVGDSVGRTDVEIESVNAIMNEIVGLMREGQNQARQVLETARDVDEAVAGNARTVEMLSQASAELRDQGDSLKRSIQHFVTA